MTTDSKDHASAAEMNALREELVRLRERLATLEGAAGVAPDVEASSKKPAEKDDAFNEEILLVISAAIAAFLGVKPHIRQIRLLNSVSWAQQGRATIQASHDLSVRHG